MRSVRMGSRFLLIPEASRRSTDRTMTDQRVRLRLSTGIPLLQVDLSQSRKLA